MDNSKAFSDGFKKAVEIKDRVIEERLIKVCEAVLAYVVKDGSHTFINRTYNLENSFTYGIYHNGKLLHEKSVGDGEGARVAKQFLSNHKPELDWSAVVVVGAWYGTLLEKYKSTGWGKQWLSGGGNFIVLSNTFDFVVMNGKNFMKI